MSCGIPWPQGPSASTCASGRQDLQRKMEWRAPTGSHILIPTPESTIRQSALKIDWKLDEKDNARSTQRAMQCLYQKSNPCTFQNVILQNTMFPAKQIGEWQPPFRGFQSPLYPVRKKYLHVKAMQLQLLFSGQSSPLFPLLSCVSTSRS